MGCQSHHVISDKNSKTGLKPVTSTAHWVVSIPLKGKWARRKYSGGYEYRPFEYSAQRAGIGH